MSRFDKKSEFKQREYRLLALIFQEDADYIAVLVEDLRQKANTLLVPVYNLSGFQAAGQTLNEMMGFYSNGTRSRLVDALESCVQSSSIQPVPNSDPTISFWSVNRDCSSLLQELRQTFSEDLERKIDSDFSVLIQYEDNMMQLFEDVEESLDTYYCAELREDLFNMTESLQNAIALALDLVRAENLPRALSLARDITGSFSGDQISDDFAEEIASVCNEFLDAFEEGAYGWGKTVTAMKGVNYKEYQITALEEAVDSSNEQLLFVMSLVTNQTERFLEGTLTTKELSETFLGEEFGLAADHLMHLIDQLEGRVEENQAGIEASYNAMEFLYLSLVYDNLPILNASNLYELWFTSLASDYEGSFLQEILSHDEDVDELIWNLYQYFLTGLLEEAKQMKELVRGAEAFGNVVDILQQNFLKYQSQTRMEEAYFA